MRAKQVLAIIFFFLEKFTYVLIGSSLMQIKKFNTNMRRFAQFGMIQIEKHEKHS